MDRKIVEESYLAFSPSLYLYALSMTKDERKAEQLVSEAYYKLLCQTHAPDQLKFWLLRVVKTSFIDQYRKKQYRQSVDLATNKSLLLKASKVKSCKKNEIGNCISLSYPCRCLIKS